MVGLMLRGFFLIGIISWYSHGVFKLINDYFGSEYKNYLTEEIKKNKHLISNDEIVKDNSVESFTLTSNIEAYTTTDATATAEIKESLITVAELNSVNDDNNRQELKVNDNQSDDGNDINDDESSIVNYWLNRKRNNYDAKNDDVHCHVEKCKDN
ncbi:hypothetical protein PVAND_003924 [Polypedilum vanderplanki]|uniref:Uncharacterized protein n=1 Tax=Polypedilum vanderplanki TaxID=319348 RepID=A0A9J6BWL0_POLVA|nr:hypothetical protein PVAND_003924 [Polypedilum vanderplanki]